MESGEKPPNSATNQTDNKLSESQAQSRRAVRKQALHKGNLL